MADFIEEQSDSPQKKLNSAARNTETKKYVVPKEAVKIIQSVPDQKYYRKALYKYVHSRNTDPLTAVYTILGWGGIGASNFRKFVRKGQSTYYDNQPLIDVLNEISTSKCGPRSAYKIIKDMKNGSSSKWTLYGLGPAYYTKLLYFYTMNHPEPCYIMDQFSARAMNYICNSNDIRLTENGLVDKSNTPEIYAEYCKRIEIIASKLRIKGQSFTPSQIEFGLFNPNSKWRKHLTANDYIAKSAKKKK